MNENNLYYKRGMHVIDKLLKTFNNDSTFYKNRLELIKSELKRIFLNQDLVKKDFNSFYITSIVSLLGLNKENIEKLNKHNNYDLSDINNIRNFDVLEEVKKNYPDFDKDRKIQTKFDKWLSVENCDHPTMCYMMNVRNGILHSEYEPLGEFGDLISIKNSNYTHFKAKAILYGILDFCELYFGNSGWLGISENFNIYGIDYQKQINNESDINDALDTITIRKFYYKYKGKTRNFKLPELKLYSNLAKTKMNIDYNKLVENVFSKNYDYSFNTYILTSEQKNIIKKMVKKYYGDNFYNLDLKNQLSQLALLTRYLYDSRMVISEWICDYISLLNHIKGIYYDCYIKNEKRVNDIIDGYDIELNKRSVFACKTSLLIIKLYHILYRLQYKNYEEADYDKVNFDMIDDDYNYERIDKDGSITYDFNIDKANMKLNYQNETDKQIENRVVCEIVRDALCHGNVEMNFKIENDELKEYIIFEDIYKGRVRKIEMTLDKLEAFLNSDAFKVENCLIKQSSAILTI